MNRWHLIRVASVLLLVACGFAATLTGGINLERLNASTDTVATADYLNYVGLPLAGTFFAALARVILRAKGDFAKLASPPSPAGNADATIKFKRTLRTLGDESAELLAEGNIDGARALSDAAERISTGKISTGKAAVN